MSLRSSKLPSASEAGRKAVRLISGFAASAPRRPPSLGSVAQAFYEHNGFTVIDRGFEPTWQLDDIKFGWSAITANAV